MQRTILIKAVLLVVLALVGNWPAIGEAQERASPAIRPPAEVAQRPNPQPTPPRPTVPPSEGDPSEDLNQSSSNRRPSDRSRVLITPPITTLGIPNTSSGHPAPTIRSPITQEGQPRRQVNPVTLAPAILPPRVEGDEPISVPLLPSFEVTEDETTSEAQGQERQHSEKKRNANREPRNRGIEPRRGPFGRLIDRMVGPRDLQNRSRRDVLPLVSANPGDVVAINQMKQAIAQRVFAVEGNRIAGLEVLVGNGRVHIRAEARRIWQRRAIKRSLEALRMPSGYRSTVEVR